MEDYYIIKKVNGKSTTYYLQGHSVLYDKPSKLSKYYLWKSERGAKLAMNKLKKEYDDIGDIWSVTNIKDEDIVIGEL